MTWTDVAIIGIVFGYLTIRAVADAWASRYSDEPEDGDPEDGA